MCCATGGACCAHTFRGSSWRSALGLESERDVFRRYKAIRADEREYLPEAAAAPENHAPAYGMS